MRDRSGRFLRGESGNPKGRPKGSKHALSEAFVRDLTAHWELHGQEAIELVFKKRPEIYLRIVASMSPKQYEMDAGDEIGSYLVRFV